MKPLRRKIISGIVFVESCLGALLVASNALAFDDPHRSPPVRPEIAAQFTQWRDSQRGNQGVFGLVIQTSRPDAIARLVTTPRSTRSNPLDLVARIHWRYLRMN